MQDTCTVGGPCSIVSCSSAGHTHCARDHPQHNGSEQLCREAFGCCCCCCALCLTIAFWVLADLLQQVLVSGQVGIAEVKLNLQQPV